MSEDEIEDCARALQRQPDPKKLFRPPPWEILVESSRDYWREKARAGDRPKAPTDHQASTASGAVPKRA